MCFELLSMGCSACFGVRSQLVSPKRIISLPSLSKKERTFSSLLKDPTGSLGGRYQARTRKDLLFDGSTSIQISSKHFRLSPFSSSAFYIYIYIYIYKFSAASEHPGFLLFRCKRKHFKNSQEKSRKLKCATAGTRTTDLLLSGQAS